MALDQDFFDSIQLEIAKKKYYNAGKVDAVIQSIREQARQVTEENAALREELSALTRQKKEIGDALLSAKTISREIILDAQQQADELLRQARAEKEAAEEEHRRREELSVQRVQETLSHMKEYHEACIASLNREWQSFLCSLDEESTPPADLSDKVDAIAREMFSLEEGDEEPTL